MLALQLLLLRLQRSQRLLLARQLAAANGAGSMAGPTDRALWLDGATSLLANNRTMQVPLRSTQVAHDSRLPINPQLHGPAPPLTARAPGSPACSAAPPRQCPAGPPAHRARPDNSKVGRRGQLVSSDSDGRQLAHARSSAGLPAPAKWHCRIPPSTLHQDHPPAAQPGRTWSPSARRPAPRTRLQASRQRAMWVLARYWQGSCSSLRLIEIWQTGQVGRGRQPSMPTHRAWPAAQTGSSPAPPALGRRAHQEGSMSQHLPRGIKGWDADQRCCVQTREHQQCLRPASQQSH